MRGGKTIRPRIAVAAIVLAILSPAVPANSWSRSSPETSWSYTRPDQCPEVFFLGARGSGQDFSTYFGMGPQVSRMFELYRDKIHARIAPGTSRAIATAPVGIDYQAISVLAWPPTNPTAYNNSVRDGVNAFVTQVELLSTRCGPAVRFVLAGFSQGAQAALYALSALPSGLRGRISAVLLLANPKFEGSQSGVSYFGVSTGSGILGHVAVPSWAVSRTAQICESTDKICHRQVGVPRHATYTDNDLLPATNAAADATKIVSGVPECDGAIATHVGSSGADTIFGTPNRDVIVGLGGNDRLEGRDGNDVICGGPGDDTIVGGNGTDACFGEAGTDTISSCEVPSPAGTWSLVSSPNPAGAGVSSLRGVACTSTTNCFAVGDSRSGPNLVVYKTLAEHWNGSKWSIVASPNPAGAEFVQLSAVACPSANSCFAVGYSEQASMRKTLVERWNGSKWSIVSAPNRVGMNSELVGIACRTPSNCFAVGDTYSDSTTTLVEHWNGSRWSIVPSPNPASGDQAFLKGVACTSATTCFAVGAVFGAPGSTLIERWDGAKWSMMVSPAPNPFAELDSVACWSDTMCVAVGDTDTAKEQTLAERWNGSRWSIVASPNPTDTVYTLGVACVSSVSCYGVGYAITSPGQANTFAEHWNGAAVKLASSRNPPGAMFSALLAIACPGPRTCFAVGNSNAAIYHTLVERLS